jgi:hypothetical protein
LAETAAIDFFTVPTAAFRVLFVFVVLGHERRRVVHFGVTEHPTQEWTSQRLREAFPWDQAPRYVLRDRDAIYGGGFAAMTRDMGMEEVLTAPRSPGKIPLWNGWWAPSDASAWITLSCGMRDRCVERFTTILPTITDREPISRWERTRPSHDPFSRPEWDRWWRCHRSADCTTVTNDGSPETYQPKLSCAHRRVSFLWSGGAGTDGKNC